MKKILLLTLLLILPLCSWAHKPSDSYLTLDLRGDTLQGQWAIALRDLDHAIGLDSNQDNVITWGELRAQHSVIANYALSHLQINADQQACAITVGAQLVDDYSDGAYTVLPLHSECAIDQALTLDYQLFFKLDAWHRGLLKVHYPDSTQTVVLAPEESSLVLNSEVQTISSWQQFSTYWREGVWHIWIGFDHILFLLALLLPSVVWRQSFSISKLTLNQGVGRWHRASSLRQVLLTVVKIVTAFTIAHSITLAAAVLGWVSLPTRWVEAGIALTVILAALNNLWPVIARHYLLAFVLGLVHGLGFANVLSDLGLPNEALVLALMAFNIGVECGQLAIVLAFIPLAYLLRASLFYRHVVLQLGSFMIAAISLVWLWQRSFL